MRRDSISTNIKRELWAQCGGYCQNPKCNKYLFANVENDLVNLANIAHIIGHGKDGPRSEHELAKIIEKDGFSNLLMLCLDCHKIVDELEKKFSVEEMKFWKTRHFQKIQLLFTVPHFNSEQELLREVNDILDENRSIFDNYGPFSKLAFEGEAGDVYKIWRRKCLDTILPNNQRIIDIFETNKRNFPYPWEAYRHMLGYKIHADSFRENRLFDERVNDYKLFPLDFDYYVKSKLGIEVERPENREREELEYRSKTISDFINRFLANHSFIRSMKQWNQYIFEVNLMDGRLLRVFATNTYYFTEYTYEKVKAIDPNIDAIICSSPYATYSESAKKRCIDEKVGLFMLKEFMGAIRVEGDKFLNYLLREEKQYRIKDFVDKLRKGKLNNKQCSIYLMGSFLRMNVFNDIDLIVVIKNNMSNEHTDEIITEIKILLNYYVNKLDITVCTGEEFSRLKLLHDNTEKIF